MAYPDPVGMAMAAGPDGPAIKRIPPWERPPSWVFWRRRYWRRQRITWEGPGVGFAYGWEYIHERKLARIALLERG